MSGKPMSQADYGRESAEFWAGFVAGCSHSVSEMQKLKADILKNGLFSDPDEREDVLLLIDAIIWEETHAARAGREERQKNLMAIASLARSIQKRESGPRPVSGGR